MNSYTLLFFFCVFLSHGVSTAGFIYNRGVYNNESSTENVLQNELKTGKYCLSNKIYNAVRVSSKAMKTYADHVCSLHGSGGSSQYINSKYGNKKELLGKGSFGYVYKYIKGMDSYAIKIPKSFKVFDLFEELHASFCIKENVPQDKLSKFGYILECVTPSGKNPHMIMNYYPTVLTDYIANKMYKGWDLEDLKTKENILMRVITLVKELNILHKAKLAHRDLKPDNIMMDSNNNPILVDFGMTSSNFDLAKSKKGTPLYMDYELTRGTGNGETSDIYALGLIIYEMVSGQGGVDSIQEMVLKGGWGTPYYYPKINTLKIPQEFVWIRNMLTPIGTGIGKGNNRWSLQQVIDKLSSLILEYDQKIKSKEENKNDLMGNNHSKQPIFTKQKTYIAKPNVPQYKALSPIKMKPYTGNPYLNNMYNPLANIQKHMYNQVNPFINRIQPQQNYIKYNAPIYQNYGNLNGQMYQGIGNVIRRNYLV